MLNPQKYTFWTVVLIVVIIKHLNHIYIHALFTRCLLSEKTGLLKGATESIKTIFDCVHRLTTPLCISELIEFHPHRARLVCERINSTKNTTVVKPSTKMKGISKRDLN